MPSKKSPDWIECLPEMSKRFVAGEDPEQLVIEINKRYGSAIKPATLTYHFRRLKVQRKGLGTAVKAADSAIRQKEIEAMKGEAEKITTIAIGIGGVIARRFLPLIDHLLANGKTLEQIAEDVMGWYETKTMTNEHIDTLEAEKFGLEKKLREALTMALPNFRYLLRTRIYVKYANRILKLRALGIPIRVSTALEDLHRDLKMLDSNLLEIKGE